MELYKYAESGVLMIMPEKEKKNLRAESSILDKIITRPSEVSDVSIFKDYTKYIFLNWMEASDKDREAWRDFFNDLVKNDNIGKTILIKSKHDLYHYTSRNVIVVMPLKERKKLRAEVSVLNKVISHPSETVRFPDIDFSNPSTHVFVGWSDSNEEEREEWRKFHS
jgi:nucleoside diphosphate kinase